MKWRAVTTEAKLLLVGIPVLLWTIIPVYHMLLFALSPRDQATSGRLWPKEPTLQNFSHVFNQQHFYLNHFWLQLWNSLWIAVAVSVAACTVCAGAPASIAARTWPSADRGGVLGPSAMPGWRAASSSSVLSSPNSPLAACSPGSPKNAANSASKPAIGPWAAVGVEGPVSGLMIGKLSSGAVMAPG